MNYERTESLGIHLSYELDNQSLEDLIILYFSVRFQPGLVRQCSPDFLALACCSGSK